MKYIPNAMIIGNQSRSSSLIINMISEIADLNPKMKNLGRLGLKNGMCQIFMIFATQNKSNILIITILTEIDDLDPKLKICEIWS